MRRRFGIRAMLMCAGICAIIGLIFFGAREWRRESVRKEFLRLLDGSVENTYLPSQPVDYQEFRPFWIKDAAGLAQLVRDHPCLAREHAIRKEPWANVWKAWLGGYPRRREPVYRYSIPHCAVGVRNGLPLLEALLECGADPNALDGGDRTPLHWAMCLPVTPNETMPDWAALFETQRKEIELLIRHGADINVRDNEGLTPLDHLREKRWAGIPPNDLFNARIQFLRSLGAKTGAELDAEAKR